MNLLVLDGNSIVNRAFYGIKLLTTKSGYYTNAIYGFLNILLKLQDTCHPDGVAVAFDVHEPTFRHKQYADYKAGRKPMPQELRAQMPVLKELLIALGYTTVECPGWEADDVLGTLAAACRDSGDTCFIATGDRDALQLAHGGVKVLLARTKMGQAVTDVYDEAAIAAEYGITPQALIQVKALQGDSSDNIPGVAGVGAKTALDLVQRFGTLDAIYKDLDTLDIKPGVREKLRRDKDKAYLSLDLGTIRSNAPIDAAPAHYAVTGGDPAAAAEQALDTLCMPRSSRAHSTRTGSGMPSNPQAHSAKRGQPAASRRTSSDHTAGRAASAAERAARRSAAWAVPS